GPGLVFPAGHVAVVVVAEGDTVPAAVGAAGGPVVEDLGNAILVVVGIGGFLVLPIRRTGQPAVGVIGEGGAQGAATATAAAWLGDRSDLSGGVVAVVGGVTVGVGGRAQLARGCPARGDTGVALVGVGHLGGGGLPVAIVAARCQALVGGGRVPGTVVSDGRAVRFAVGDRRGQVGVAFRSAGCGIRQVGGVGGVAATGGG